MGLRAGRLWQRVGHLRDRRAMPEVRRAVPVDHVSRMPADISTPRVVSALCLTAFPLAYRGSDGGPAGSPSSLRYGSPDYEVPRRDRFGRKKIRRWRGAADQPRRVEKRGRALMTDVRAG